MIFGNINSYNSCGFHSEKVDRYVELLRSIPKDAPDGKVFLDGGAFYSVSSVNLSPKEKRRFEAHRRFIDIQFVLDGCEYMEYADIEDVRVSSPYNEERDVGFFEGEGDMLTVRNGDFAIFFPQDAHKPCIGEGVSRKVVVKIPI